MLAAREETLGRIHRALWRGAFEQVWKYLQPVARRFELGDYCFAGALGRRRHVRAPSIQDYRSRLQSFGQRSPRSRTRTLDAPNPQTTLLHLH